MARTFQTTPENLCNLLVQGIEAEFKAELHRRFTALAQPLIEQAAKSAAESIAARVMSYYRIEKDRHEVIVQFNDNTL